jgi:hypothetical protein
MSSHSIPYFANNADLPADLPTVAEIAAATDILHTSTGRKVVGIGTHFVVKYGQQVDVLEGSTTLFLSQSTSVPVPRIYALFQNPDKTTTYIVMERIHGSCLANAWPAMHQASKEAVASQLQCILQRMRELPSPGGYCSVGRRGLPDGLFWTQDPTKLFAGPFDTEAQLNAAMLAKYVADGLSKHKAAYYARAFGDVFRGHEPRFSHADLQRKNIMVRHGPAVEGEAKWEVASLDVVLIDWEYAGWYPSYWEYARAIFACGRWDDDWNEWVDGFLEPWRSEYAWVQMLLGEMWS